MISVMAPNTPLPHSSRDAVPATGHFRQRFRRRVQYVLVVLAALLCARIGSAVLSGISGSYSYEVDSNPLLGLPLLLLAYPGSLCGFLLVCSYLAGRVQLPYRKLTLLVCSVAYIFSFFVLGNHDIVASQKIFLNRHIDEYNQFVRRECNSDICRLPSLYQGGLGINSNFEEYFVFDKRDILDKCHRGSLPESACSYMRQLAIDNGCYAIVTRISPGYFAVFQRGTPIRSSCDS
jgi:hypothetical protein